MNKQNKLFTIVEIALLIVVAVFGFTACGGNDNPPQTYTVTFDSNGGSDVASVTVEKGDTVEKSDDPIREGYEFIGWYKEAALTNVWDFDVDTVTANTTIYAKWGLALNINGTGPGGGKIFYRSEDGFTMADTGEVCHYLEAALNDMPEKLAWLSPSITSDLSVLDDLPERTTVSEIGTGRKNTAFILSIDPDAPAAKACNGFTNNGKTDWFFPSINELLQLYNNKDSVGNFKSGSYSSSSQNGVYFRNGALGYDFEDGQRWGMDVFAQWVRPIRAF